MDFDSKELTLRQAAEIYATQYAKKRKGFDNPADVQRFVASTISMFKDIADEPGSAVALFIPDENDKRARTPLAKLFEDTAADDQPVKKAMQNLRLIGHNVLKAGLKPTDELYQHMPDSAVASDKNERLFGRGEPAKGESLVAINPDENIQKEFFAKLSAKTANPETRKSALAALFLLNTGVRPEILENLRFDHYNAEKGALYIPGDIGGAKGRPINIPLNPVADAIIQEFMKERIEGGFADSDGPNKIFFKYSKTGNKGPIDLKPKDVTDVLRDIKVGNKENFGLIYDEKTQRHYDTLTPPELASAKSGSRLLRNFHATLGDRLFGIPAERLAYLEGRTLKSVRKNLQTGSLEVYQVTFPFDVNEDDRAFASRFASFTQDASEDLGLDFTRVIDLETASQTRIFGDDPRYSSYFKTPTEKAPDIPESLIVVSADDKGLGIDEKTLETLKKKPVAFRNYLDSLDANGVDTSQARAKYAEFIADKSGKVPGKSGPGSGRTGAALAAITAGGVGVDVLTSEDAAAATSEIARDVAIDVAGETGLKRVVGRTLAGRIPVADVLLPSANMAGEGVSTPAPGTEPVAATPEELYRKAEAEADRPLMDPSRGGLPALVGFLKQKTQEAKAEPDDNFLTMSP